MSKQLTFNQAEEAGVEKSELVKRIKLKHNYYKA